MEQCVDSRQNQNTVRSVVSPSSFSSIDQESQNCLAHMMDQEVVLQNRVSGVKYVLIVLSARGIVFDREALSQKVMLSYPDAAVFYQTSRGHSISAAAPEKIDLLIDLTGPNEKQGLCYAKKLRRMARVAVGRNVGYFRRRIYDRIFDEFSNQNLIPKEILERERFVQKEVFNLAGVAFLPSGRVPVDRSKTIALELPRMQQL